MEFPAFLKLEYQADNSAKDRFIRAVDDTLDSAQKRFEEFGSEAQRIVGEALSLGRTNTGALNLNVPGLREAAREQQNLATAAREVATATATAAREAGDYSQQARLAVAATEAYAKEQEAAAVAALSHAEAARQVQSVLDRQASSTRQISGTFLQLAQAEAGAADGAKMLEGIYRGTALAIGHVANSARDSAAVFEQMFAAQERAAAQMDALRRAEVGAAESAAILSATYRNTALASDYMTKSAREAASSFEVLFQARAAVDEKAAQDFLNAAFGLDAITKSARDSATAFAELYTAQRKIHGDFVELARIEAAQADGALMLQGIYRGTAEELGYAGKSARDSAAAFAELGHEQLRGTSQLGAITNGIRAQRFAYVQLGQQMTDVVVQAQMGAKWPTIFVQQVPQMAFALSGLKGKIGDVARVLSGPLGAAIFASTALLVPFVVKMIEGSDASRKLTAADIDLASALDRHRASQEELNKAIDAYNQKQIQATEQTRLYTQQALAAAQADLSRAVALREQIKADQEVALAHPGAVGGDVEGFIAVTQSRMSENDREIARLQTEINNRLIDMGELATKALDPLEAVRQKYSDIAAELTNIANGKNGSAFVSGVGLVGGTVKDGRFTGQIPGVGSGSFNNVPLDQVRSAIGAAQKVAETAVKAADKLHGDLVQFGSPLAGPLRVSSGYGQREKPTAGASTNHLGIDYAAPLGTPVLAAMDGIVKFANAVNGYGNEVALNHGAGTETRYAHLSRFAVKEGDTVSKGQVIGYVGQTGVATGPHLHYEVLVNGKKVDPSKGNFPVDATKVAEEGEKARAAAQRAAEQLQQFGDRSAESIARINEQFDAQPKLIDQAAAATRKLDDIIADLSEKKPAGFEQMIADAEHAKGTIQEALVRPFQELLRDSERRQQVEDLVLKGHDAEAAALQDIWHLEDQIGTLTDAQKANVEAIAAAEQKHIEALEKAKTIQEAFLSATQDVRSEIERIIAGEGKLSDFKTIFRQLNAKVLTEQIFGGALRDLDKWVKENTGIKDSVDYLRDQTHDAGEAALNFAETVNRATSAIATGSPLGGGSQVSAGLGSLFDSVLPASAGGSSAGVSADLAQLFDAVLPPTAAASAANDNEIVVVGKKLDKGITGLTPDRYFQEMAKRITQPITDKLAELVGPKFAGALGGVMSQALYGYATGGTPGGIIGSVKGLVDGLGGANGPLSKALGGALKGAQTGTMVAGLGNALGLHLSTTGSQIGGALGSALPIPGGEIIGSVVGGLLGKLFGGTKSGRVALGGSSYSVGGTSKKVQTAASEAGDSFLDSLESIADQLGGTLGSYGTITVGQRDGKWRVNVGGSGSGSLKTKNGAKDFGTDEQAAIAYALQQAIVNGAVQGISAGAKRLISSGKDLQTQLQKALDFQSVFDDLKAYKDPVGAALDELDRKFAHLKDVFAEAGASTAEYAQLEELYGIERAKAIKDATDQISGALKDLYADLTTGDMGLSLRDRKTAAQTTYDSLAARVRSGDTSAYDDYADAARTLLDIERQLYGSQSEYFDLFNEVRDLTKATLDRQTALADASANRDSPFSGSSTGTSATADNQGVIDGLAQLGSTIVDGLGPKLDAMNANLASSLARVAATGGPAQYSLADLLRAQQGYW